MKQELPVGWAEIALSRDVLAVTSAILVMLIQLNINLAQLQP